jgi:hypothetical protein
MIWGRAWGSGRGDGGSIFILPIDIFFKKPHRLLFSLPGAARIVSPPSKGNTRGGDVLFCAIKDEPRDRDKLVSTRSGAALFSHIDWVSGRRALPGALRDGLPFIAFAGPTLANRFCMPGRGGVWLSRFVLDCEVA